MPPDSPWSFDREKILNFLTSKGGVELLLLLEEGDKRHSELEDQIPVAESTFHTRREQAVDLWLITSDSRTRDGSVVPVYTLTPHGEVICRKARHEQVLGIFHTFLNAREEFYEKRETVVDWVADEDSEFEDRIEEAKREKAAEDAGLSRHEKHYDYDGE